MTKPVGAPYFNGAGQWDAYINWNLMVPCKGCGKRKIDNPSRYGLKPLSSWPDYWVTEEWCCHCWKRHCLDILSEVADG